MSKYTCEKCGKNFKQKSHYTSHLNRKNPCINESKITELINKAVETKLNNINKNNIINIIDDIKDENIILTENDSSDVSISDDEEYIFYPSKNISNKENKKLCTDIGKFNFIEVCAGGGGLSSGLIKAGMTPLLLNDNNADCCKTLKKNHPDAIVLHESMNKIDFNQYIGKVDLLTGGVPCQSFSQAGLRNGLDDPRGDLMLKFIDILNLIKPKMFMIENVKGLITHNNGETIKTIIETINQNNLYNITYKCLDASKYDVPQKRERVFIVGVLKTSKLDFKFPEESSKRIVLKDVLKDVPSSGCAKYSQEKINLFKQIPQGGCWVDLPENLQKEYLGNSYYSGGGKRGILHRLSMEKPSLTLLCSPSQKQTERCHPLEDRPLSVREYARIQTFEDNYEFVGSLNSQYKQIGNAVPVELAKKMGISIIETLTQF